MISVVMFGHALLPYLTVPRRYKDPDTSEAFDVIAVFLYSFAMPVFFVTAGFAAAVLYQKRGLRGLARNRFRTIFLPLLVAYLLLSPLTRGAYAFAAEVATNGTLQAGIDRLMRGDWIRWSKAYHLWFLVSLLLYTALTLCVRWVTLRVLGDRAARFRQATRTLFSSRWRSLLLAAIFTSTLVPAYVLFDGDATTWPMQLTLLGFFMFGWLLCLHRDLLPTLRGGAWRQIAVAVAALPVVAWSTRERLFAPHEIDLAVGTVAGIGNAVLAAFMTFGLLGIFQGRFDQRPSPLGQYLSEASYWIFLIHLPLLIFVGGALSATSLPAAVKYLLTVLIVVPVVFASYHFGVRTTLMGRLLKGKRERPAGVPR